MATKTISIDLEAYERLTRARKTPTESFSRVIKRAHWHDEGRTAGGLLGDLENLPPLADEAIDLLDRAQGSDGPPEDPWSPA